MSNYSASVKKLMDLSVGLQGSRGKPRVLVHEQLTVDPNASPQLIGYFFHGLICSGQ